MRPLLVNFAALLMRLIAAWRKRNWSEVMRPTLGSTREQPISVGFRQRRRRRGDVLDQTRDGEVADLQLHRVGFDPADVEDVGHQRKQMLARGANPRQILGSRCVGGLSASSCRISP